MNKMDKVLSWTVEQEGNICEAVPDLTGLFESMRARAAEQGYMSDAEIEAEIAAVRRENDCERLDVSRMAEQIQNFGRSDKRRTIQELFDDFH